jgi:hypothetical protein
MLQQPGIVAHADWSAHDGKRWLCVAERLESGYRISAPEPVGDAGSLPDRLMERSPDGAVLLGVDFPLGFPKVYAEQLGIRTFAEILPDLGRDEWHEFFELCDEPGQISLYRPFFPRRPGGTSHAQLCRGLGVDDIDQLRRRCELKTADRNAASPLFWTLGSQQVGRAAISGWRELLQPAIARGDGSLRLWPFEGGLERLLSPDSVVVAETYPAESALHVGLTAPGRRWSKRRQADRAIHAVAVGEWAARRGVTIGEALQPVLRDGFGNLATGEDQFDSLIGVTGMLEVVLGGRPEMPPLSNERRLVEGWILGQS